MKQEREQANKSHDSNLRSAALPIAFFIPLILATAYLNMGPTCCGSSCPDNTPKIYPNHVSIDVPVVRLEGRLNGEDPFFLAMEWEATSAAGTEPGDVAVRLKKRGLPSELRADAKQGEHIVLGEDVSKAVFDFPEIGFSVSDARQKHIKIAGLTMCAFDRDDGNALETVHQELADFATILNNSLKDYADHPFGDPAAQDVFKATAEALMTQVEGIWDAMTPEQKNDPPNVALHTEVTQQLQGLIDLAVTGINTFKPAREEGTGSKAVPATAILGFIGQAVELIPNIISLFRKRHRSPDYDDFAGCASVMYVGLPHSVFRETDFGITEGDCSKGEGGSELAVCAIDRDPMGSVVRFDAPRDQKERFDTRLWQADIELRKGQYRTSSSTHTLRGAGHKYVVVNSAAGEQPFKAPSTKGPYSFSRNPVCNRNGRQSGTGEKGDLNFAHMVSYQTQGAHALSYEIQEIETYLSVPWEFDIKAWDTGGSNNRSNVSVRLSTVTIPDYVRWKRVVVDLEAGPTNLDIEVVPHPSGYEGSPNLIIIPEFLSIEEVDAQGSLNISVNESAESTVLRLDGPGNLTQCLGYPISYDHCRNKARIRLTYIYWSSGAVHFSEAEIGSTDDNRTDPDVPARKDMGWEPPFIFDQPDIEDHLGATLYFPTSFWQAGSRNAGFTVRASGTEVSEHVDGRARLYAQDFYHTSDAFVIGKVVSFRFE